MKFLIDFKTKNIFSQLQMVRDQELVDIESKIARLYGQHRLDPPKLGFVVLNKKTNTRIFTTGGRNGAENPLPGTVADDVITLPER